MTPDQEIAWLAGLLEGEGHFGRYKNTDTVSLRMCDEDVVQAAATVLSRIAGKEVIVREVINRTQSNRQPVYYIQLYGGYARRVMRAIVDMMGERRNQKIISILEKRVLIESIDLKEIGL